jgi:hypothetical protein
MIHKLVDAYWPLFGILNLPIWGNVMVADILTEL